MCKTVQNQTKRNGMMNYNRGIFTLFSINSNNLKLLIRLLVQRYWSIGRGFTVAFSLKNKTAHRNDVNACKTTGLIIEASSPYSSIISTWYFYSVRCLSFTVLPSMTSKKNVMMGLLLLIYLDIPVHLFPSFLVTCASFLDSFLGPHSVNNWWN